MMRITRSLTAVASAALLALGGVALAATSASAAEEVLRPGVQSPSLEPDGSTWRGAPQKDRFAQPFIQSEAGNLAKFSILINSRVDVFGNGIQSAAVYEFDPATGPMGSPILSGTAGEIAFLPDGEGQVWAEIDFPDRPLLSEGVRYAVVIDSLVAEGQNASIPMRVQWSNHTPDFFAWEREDGSWKGVGTMHSIFTSQLTTSAETPDPEIPGETPNGEEPGDGSPATNAPKKPKAVETGLAA